MIANQYNYLNQYLIIIWGNQIKIEYELSLVDSPKFFYFPFISHFLRT